MICCIILHVSPYQCTHKFITNDKPIIFDVGAHHGESIIEFKTLFPLSIIHSFEPDPDTFKILQANTFK